MVESSLPTKCVFLKWEIYFVAGDGHFCPQCQRWSTIIKSHDHILFDDKAVAYVGDQLTCGAKILPKQFHVVGRI